MPPEPGYANVGVYGGSSGAVGVPGAGAPAGLESGPSGPVAGPSGLVAGPSGLVAGPSRLVAGPSGLVVGPSGLAGPAPPRWRPLYVQRQDSEQESLYESVGGACWWRCRRPGRAQTLEFHSRGPDAGCARTHTVPRLRALCGVRVQLDARLSASCAAMDVALPPCVLHYRVLPDLPDLPDLADLADLPGRARVETESDDD